MDTKPDLNWTFSPLWNKALEEDDSRPLEVRDYLYASELFNAPVDTYLKMRATPYSNPPNARSLRKFEAGHLMEWIVGMMLKRAGILVSTEKRVENTYPGLLRVSGRIDQIASGIPNYEKAKAELEALGLPTKFLKGLEQIVKYLQEKYPEGLAEKPIEIKSVSSFVADAMERKPVPIKRHAIQTWDYLKGTGYPVGILLYICRDDLRMFEYNIALADSNLAKTHFDRVELLTENHADTIPPPQEKMIVFEEDFGKFSKNFNVEYSPYLKMLYGFEEPRAYSEIFGKKATSFNRVIKRMKNGDTITAKNLIVIEEMQAEGFKPAELLKFIPDVPVEEESTTDD